MAEARWSPEGRLRAGEPAEERERIHVDCDRSIGVSLLEGDANEAAEESGRRSKVLVKALKAEPKASTVRAG